MPTNSLIDRTDAGALIPEDVSRTIIQGLPAASVTHQLPPRHDEPGPAAAAGALGPARRLLGGRDTGLKQTTEQNWANKYLDARELAVIVPIPRRSSTTSTSTSGARSVPPGRGVRGEDRRRLFGTDSPAGWPDSIVEAAVAAGNVVEVGESTGDIAADVNLVMGKVEEDGFDVNGFWARRA